MVDVFLDGSVKPSSWQQLCWFNPQNSNPTISEVTITTLVHGVIYITMVVFNNNKLTILQCHKSMVPISWTWVEQYQVEGNPVHWPFKVFYLQFTLIMKTYCLNNATYKGLGQCCNIPYGLFLPTQLLHKHHDWKMHIALHSMKD